MIGHMHISFQECIKLGIFIKLFLSLVCQLLKKFLHLSQNDVIYQFLMNMELDI